MAHYNIEHIEIYDDMKPNINNRFQAFFLHLIFSILTFILFLYLVIYKWYPTPYIDLEGGWYILIILLCIHVILGPLLTLIIFKKGKPDLHFDLTVIACLQIAAFIYGGNIIYQERPAYIVFAVDRFTVVSTRDIDTRLLIGTDFDKSDSSGPIPVFASMPENITKRNNLMFETLTEGAPDLEYRAEYYEPFQPNLKKAILRSSEITQHYLQHENKTKIKDFLERNNLLEKNLSFFPLVGKKKDMLVAVNRKTGNIEGAIDIDPWLNN